jgi:hypothetical protein
MSACKISRSASPTTYNYMQTTTRKSAALASLLTATVLGAGSAFAATTDSKGGMMTTTTDSYARPTSDGLPGIAKGVQELGLDGRLNWEDDTEYNLNASYGRFVTDNWLLGGEVAFNGVNSDKNYGVGFFAEYNFLTGTKWVPFLGASVGYSRNEIGDNSDRANLGLTAGIKYFVSTNLAVAASMGGGWTSDGEDEFQKEIDLGLRFYF